MRPLIPSHWDIPTDELKSAEGVKWTVFKGEEGMVSRALSPRYPASCNNCDTILCTCSAWLNAQYGTHSLRAWGIDHNVLDIMAREFYGILALRLKYPEPSPSFDDFIAHLADQMYRGIVLACAGEARYDVDIAFSGLWGARVKRRGSKVLDLPVYHTPAFGFYRAHPRGAYDRAAITRGLLNVVDPYDIKFTRFLRNMFLWAGRYSRGLGGGYGGLMWAACAQIALDWRAGRMNDIEFIDRAFNSRHNGAPVLTKVFSHGGHDFERWLSARAEASLEWLIRWTPNVVRAAFGLEAALPLRGSSSNIHYSEDGETPWVIPDDADHADTPEGRGFYPAPEKSSTAFIAPLLSPLRKGSAFFTFGGGCTCKHGCRNMCVEHDCEDVCAAERCYCSRRLASIDFHDAPRSDETHDPDPDNDGSHCRHCGSRYHETDECEYHYCEICDEYALHTTDTCPNKYICEVDGCGHESCFSDWQTRCGFCKVLYHGDCSTCGNAHNTLAHLEEYK